MIGSVIAAYLTYAIYRYNRLSPGWLALAIAFILIVFRRSIGFAIDRGYATAIQPYLKASEGVLLLIISLFNIWGLWAMKKNFENFEVVEKKVRERVNAFTKKKKRDR